MRPSGVETAMTGGLDVESESVDKQSVEVWNEVLELSDDNFSKFECSASAKQDEKQPSNHDEV